MDIHTDHLNTPRLITNQVGQAVWRYDNNDPFGGNVPDENPSGLGTFTCNLRFPGQYFDKETNLHYNYFRDYDPATGRYPQSDPIGLRGGMNTYAYDNPLSFFDPDGLQVRLMCRLLDDPLARITARIYGQPQKHCFVYVSCPEEGWAYTLSLFGVAPGFRQGEKNIATPLNPARNDDPNSPNLTNDIPIIPQIPGCGTCAYEKDVLARFNRFPNTVPYYGPYVNSNSFANQMIYSPAFGASVPQGAVANAPGISSSYSIIGIGR